MVLLRLQFSIYEEGHAVFVATLYFSTSEELYLPDGYRGCWRWVEFASGLSITLTSVRNMAHPGGSQTTNGPKTDWGEYSLLC